MLLSKLLISYYPEPNKPNYGTKRELEHATGADTSGFLGGKKYFIALKAEVDKLDIATLVNIPTSLNNIKIKLVT